MVGPLRKKLRSVSAYMLDLVGLKQIRQLLKTLFEINQYLIIEMAGEIFGKEQISCLFYAFVPNKLVDYWILN